MKETERNKGWGVLPVLPRRLITALCLLTWMGGQIHAATLTWNGGAVGDWVNGGSGWLNGGTPATWNNATPDAAIFSGTLTLSPTVNAGGITVGNMTFSSGDYSFSGGTLTLSSGNIDVGSGLTATFNQTLAGTAGLTKSGAGTLSLVGNNKNYTGTTTINGGVLLINGLANGNMGSSSSGNLTLNGGALHTDLASQQTLNYVVTAGVSGGELRNLNTSRVILGANKLSGSGMMTYSFGSAVTRIILNGQSGFSGKVVVNSGGDTNKMVDVLSSSSFGSGSGDDAITLQNYGSLLLRNGVTVGGVSQGITLGSGETRFAVAGGAAVSIAGKISGPLGNDLHIFNENATSVSTLNNVNSAWLGGLNLAGGGVLRLGAAGVLPDNGGNVNIASTATLDLNGFNEVIGGLTGSGTANVRVASATVSLGVGANNNTTTFSGFITNSASGSSLQLVKVGTGTLTLSGNGIGHAGGTIISNGTLEISAAGAGRLGATSSAAVTLQGGTLQGNFSANTTVGNTITVGANGGTIRNIGTDSQRWQMSDNQLYGSGTLTLAFGSQNTRFTMASAQNNFTGKWIINSGGNVNRFVDLNYASGNGFGAATGDDAITLEDSAGVLIRNGLAFGTPVQGITLGSGRAKIAVASTSTGTVAGKISGPSANNVQFYLDNADSVIIISNTANSWAGTSQVNAGGSFGTLRLGAAGVIPDTGGVFEVTTTARLDLNGFSETVGSISGSGRIDTMADGSSATLSIGANNGNWIFSGFITNSGSGSSLAITKVGSGTQTFSTANGYVGATTIDAGALRIGHANALGSSTAGSQVNPGGALELSGGITVASEPLVVNGTGVSGGGALRNVSGNNNWDGTIQINNTAPVTIASDSGDLKLRGAISLTGSVAPTFQGNGNIFIQSTINSDLVRGSGSGDVLISSGVTVNGNVTVTSSAVGAFKVEGTLNGDVTMNGGQLTGVNGTMGDMTMNSGLLSPAANGVSVLNMDSLTITGGAYQWNITNATGTAGVNWDLARVGGGAGVIDLSGAGTGSITVRVTFASSSLTNFNHQAAGSWMIADGGSVVGFAAGKFTVSDAAFTPGSEGGTWSVSTSGGDLYVNYTPGTPVDLAVTVTDTPDPAPVGDTITYTLVITNKSSVTVSEYTVTNRLSTWLSYLGSSDGGSHSAGVVRWTLSNLAPNSARTISMTASHSTQGSAELVADVRSRRAEAVPVDNTVTSRTSVFCPTAGLAPNDAPASRTATNGMAVSFTVNASNDDCNAPFLYASGLPSGATFTVITSGYAVAGTFSWGSPVSGVHPLRFYSYNETKATSTVVTLLYVNNGSEANNGAGIPVSLTNWHVAISTLDIPVSGNTTIQWDADPGIPYDIYTSPGPLLLSGMSWNLSVSHHLAEASLEEATFAFSGRTNFIRVVPHGKSPSLTGAWASIKPTIVAGYSMMSAPLDLDDLSFAGAFGETLAENLDGDNGGNGDKVMVIDPGGAWRTLYLMASPRQWSEDLSTESNYQLAAGQGFFIYRGGSSVTASFTGPVGNQGAASRSISAGWNIIAPSEGVTLTFNQVIANLSGTTTSGWTEDDCDQIAIDEGGGQWRRIMRYAGSPSWLDLKSFSTPSVSIRPGQAIYYFRHSGGALSIGL